MRVIVVPATAKQLMDAPDREEWYAADQLALDAILAVPGNELKPLQNAIDQGLPVYDCVTTRKVKLDQKTGRLARGSGEFRRGAW